MFMTQMDVLNFFYVQYRVNSCVFFFSKQSKSCIYFLACPSGLCFLPFVMPPVFTKRLCLVPPRVRTARSTAAGDFTTFTWRTFFTARCRASCSVCGTFSGFTLLSHVKRSIYCEPTTAFYGVLQCLNHAELVQQ